MKTTSRHLATLSAAAMCLVAGATRAQSVQPLIAEYTDHASGTFEVTNSSLFPAVVLLEPRSFTINTDGAGEFRPLDSSIHLELSATSLRLDARQTAHVFYKVTADHVPAWLCIYASFSSLKKNQGLNVRMMLPHTVYLYQREPLAQNALHISNLRYDAAAHKITAEIENLSDLAGRAQGIEVTAGHASAVQGGFPVLPREKRNLTIDWTESQAPKDIAIQFPHFALKQSFSVAAE